MAHFIFLALLIGAAQFSEIAGRPTSEQNPGLPVFQVLKGFQRTTQPLLTISNTEGDKVLIVNSTEINTLMLRCGEDYPVRITYEGQASPFQQRSSGKSYVVFPDKPGREFFNEEVYFMSLDPSLTHKYICHSVQFPERRSTIDIYIPSENLFANNFSETFKLENDTEKFVVPCGVTHPDTSVTLSKFNKDGNRPERIQADFEPMHGFIVDVNPFEDPSGKYVCTATLGNNTRVIEHSFSFDKEFYNKTFQFSKIGGGPSDSNNPKTNANNQPSLPVFQALKGVLRFAQSLLTISNTDGGSRALIINSTEINSMMLRCDANYPVRITYEAQGSFQQISSGKNHTVLPNNPGMEFFNEEVYFMPLDPSLTHKYICHSVQFPEIRSTIDIYISSENLFIEDFGETLQLGNATEKFVVPCGVTHPDTLVTLSKFNKDGNEAEIIQADFEPMHGFIVEVNPLEDPSGKYVCNAKLGNNTRVIEHTFSLDQEFDILQ